MIALPWDFRVGFVSSLHRLESFLGCDSKVPIFHIGWLNLNSTFAKPIWWQIKNLGLKLAIAYQLLEGNGMPVLKVPKILELRETKSFDENEIATLYAILDAWHSNNNFIIFLVIG